MIHQKHWTRSWLNEALQASWSVETGAKWLPTNRARGQCIVTALVVQDILGGDILKTDVDGYWHFYNQIDGRRCDLTMSQFGTPIEYDDLPSTREEALTDTSPEQYRLLHQRVLDWQNRSEGRVAHLRLEPVVDKLPADFEIMREEAHAEGHAFLDRLANDWASGAMRFDRPGKALLAAYSEGVLAAIGGITIDPIFPDALRMRRFYVRSAFRRAGIGREIAHALLEGALQRVRVVTLNAAVESVPFWEALGFVPQARDGHTHVWRQAEPKR